MDKIYAVCTTCDNYCYRIIGHRHGDGQVDTNDNPVWLLCEESDIPDGAEVVKINCGC